MNMLRSYLDRLMRGENLSTVEMKDAMLACFESGTTDTEIAALLTALKIKGETADEIAGMVEVIQSKSEMANLHLSDVMDNCGKIGRASCRERVLVGEGEVVVDGRQAGW